MGGIGGGYARGVLHLLRQLPLALSLSALLACGGGQQADGGQAADAGAARESAGQAPAAEEESTDVHGGVRRNVLFIAIDDLRTLATEAGYSVVERDWLERNSVPNDDFNAATPVQRFLRGNVDMHGLEPGQVAPAVASPAGDEVYLVRLEGKQEQAVDGIGAQTLLQLRGAARSEDRREFGAKVFLGDGPWMTETVGVGFPERTRREAERAADAG